jgi:hypothetical protein
MVASQKTCRNTWQKLSVNAYKIDRDWPTVLNMLTKGGGERGRHSDQPEMPHPALGLAVTCRTQVVREYLMTIPRRRLTDGTEGKTTIPFRSILQLASSGRHTPDAPDKGRRCIPALGAQGSATFPQAKGMDGRSKGAYEYLPQAILPQTTGRSQIPPISPRRPLYSRPAPCPPEHKVQQPFRRPPKWMKQS